MSRTDYRFLDGDTNPYFITATIVNWLPLLSNPSITQILLNSLKFLIERKRLIIHAYVIMENHMHMVASAIDYSKEIGDFKSFTARKSIDFYCANQNQSILDQLAFHKLTHKRDRPYQFWQEGSHPERVMDEKMMRQKIEYIHANPVRRGYVDLPEHWRYSSARDYYLDVPGLLPISKDW